MPYVHQQNSMAKHLMRTILNETQIAMTESGLPVKYWVDAVQIVVYIQNLLPNS